MKKLTAIFFALCLAACNRGKKADKQAESLVFDRVEVDTVAAFGNDAGGPKCRIVIHLDYAKGPNAHVINDTILKSGIFLDDELKRGEKKTVPKAVDIVVKNHFKAFRQECKEIQKQGGEMAAECYYSVESSHGYGRDSIINYQAVCESYMGGAHGWHNIFALNFDPKTGALIRVSDFIKKGAEDRLSDMIAAKIAAEHGCKSVDDLRDREGIFGVFDPYVPDNFVIGKDSVEFIYQCEEIGPYAVGGITTKFSYNDLNGCLK